MGEAGLRLRRSRWARDGTGLRLWTLPSDRAHVYPDVQDLEQPWRMAVPTPRDAPGPTPGHGGPAALRDDGVLAGPDLEFRAFCARRGLGCLAGRAIPARRDRPAAGLHRQPVPATLTARPRARVQETGRRGGAPRPVFIGTPLCARLQCTPFPPAVPRAPA